MKANCNKKQEIDQTNIQLIKNYYSSNNSRQNYQIYSLDFVQKAKKHKKKVILLKKQSKPHQIKKDQQINPQQSDQISQQNRQHNFQESSKYHEKNDLFADQTISTSIIKSSSLKFQHFQKKIYYRIKRLSINEYEQQSKLKITQISNRNCKNKHQITLNKLSTSENLENVLQKQKKILKFPTFKREINQTSQNKQQKQGNKKLTNQISIEKTMIKLINQAKPKFVSNMKDIFYRISDKKSLKKNNLRDSVENVQVKEKQQKLKEQTQLKINSILDFKHWKNNKIQQKQTMKTKVNESKSFNILKNSIKLSQIKKIRSEEKNLQNNLSFNKTKRKILLSGIYDNQKLKEIDRTQTQQSEILISQIQLLNVPRKNCKFNQIKAFQHSQQKTETLMNDSRFNIKEKLKLRLKQLNETNLQKWQLI